jgi:hypothetical protein
VEFLSPGYKEETVPGNPGIELFEHSHTKKDSPTPTSAPSLNYTTNPSPSTSHPTHITSHTMKFSAILALASIAAVVSAQSPGADEGRLYYTEPTTATVWTAGQNHTVAWSNVCKSENTGDLDIVLYRGTGNLNGTEQVRVTGIPPLGKLNCLKNKSATVFIPANLTTSDKYALHVNTEPRQSYSSPFTIKGVDPVVPPTTTAVVPPPSTSSAAVGGSSTGPAATGSTSAPAAGKPTNGAGSLKAAGSSAVVVLAALALMI